MTEPAIMEPYPLVWTDDNVKRFWDFEARHPERYFGAQIAQTFPSHVTPYLKPGTRILDYGAGLGHLVSEFLRLGYNVGAVDFSEQSIRAAEARNHGAPGFLGARSTTDCSAWNGTFDLVLLSEVVEHLTDEHLIPTIQICLALLKPAGVLVITTPNAENLEESEVFCPNCQQVFHRWQHVRSWTPQSLASFLSSLGANVLETRETNLAVTLERQQPASLSKRLRAKLLGRIARWMGVETFLPALARPQKPHLLVVCSQ